MRVFAIVFLVLICCVSVIAPAMNVPTGPAPNAGDGVPDGSGMEPPAGDSAGTADSFGPAPNAGDGIPDGSGLAAPASGRA